MADETSARSLPDMRRTAWALAVGGAVPLVLIAAAMLASGRASGWFPLLADAFRTWSAMALAFVGGIRWGLALRREPASVAHLALSALAAAIAWPALFLPDRIGIAVLLVAHCGQGAWDSFSFHRDEGPQWFGQIRIAATLLAALAHILAFAALF